MGEVRADNHRMPCLLWGDPAELEEGATLETINLGDITWCRFPKRHSYWGVLGKDKGAGEEAGDAGKRPDSQLLKMA